MTPELRNTQNDTSSPLDTLRRRDPYRMPPDFIERLTDEVIARVASEQAMGRHRRFTVRLRLWATAAVSAAAVALIAINLLPGVQHSESLTPDQAFERLSASDQEYLLDNYRNDMVMDYAAL